jgi:catechol 2,3-dioxygenase-like lactoylglutathione lyase family enzyme
MASIINGVQHLGVGVPDLDSAWKWYRQFFGINIPFFNAEAPAPLMQIYTDGEVITKRAAMVMNLKGGCAMEVVQPTSFKATHAKTQFQLGDLGIFIGHVKTPNSKKAFDYFKNNNANVQGELTKTPDGLNCFFVKDPNGLLFQVIEANDFFSNDKTVTGGIMGCTIAVSDIEKSLRLYADLLGYNHKLYDKTETFNDFKEINEGSKTFRRIKLIQKNQPTGGFNKVGGITHIELVQEISDRPKLKMYEGRKWGDIGFVHLGFDVRGMKEIGKKLEQEGFGFTCDTNNVLSMGDSTKVHCTYIEDPDGTLIEMIEVYKIPIIEKLGINLNVEKSPLEKPLPNWLLKALRFSRVKD